MSSHILSLGFLMPAQTLRYAVVCAWCAANTIRDLESLHWKLTLGDNLLLHQGLEPASAVCWTWCSTNWATSLPQSSILFSLVLHSPLPHSSGACQTDINDKGGPWNAGNANAKLLYQGNGVLTLNYSGGDICHHNDVSRTTIINFICHDGAGDGIPTYVDSSDGCVYYFDWHTELVCEEQVRPLVVSVAASALRVPSM